MHSMRASDAPDGLAVRIDLAVPADGCRAAVGRVYRLDPDLIAHPMRDRIARVAAISESARS